MKSLSTVVFLLCCLCSFAQTSGQPARASGTVKGIVRENNKPVQYATVFLTLTKDTTKIVAGTVTDSLGRFFLDKLPIDRYLVHIQIIRYTSKQILVSIEASDQLIDLGEIRIETDALLLNAVEVTAIRNLIQKTEEGFVVNAADNITQIGGTAADLLKNMPGVLVGADGEITLRGKSPLTLINGRISGIAGMDRGAQLERIPASSIDRIEIINNPSAKYDADAEGGIINIILKKSEGSGTNGAFAVGVGLGDRYRLNGSILLNHKINKWNFGAAYDNWYTTRTRRVWGDRINYELADEYYLTQRRFDERLIFYQNAKATIDYELNKNSSLSLEVLWAFPGEDNNETLKNTFETSENHFTSGNQRYSNEIRRSNALEFSLNYAKHFSKPGKLLSVNVSNTFNNESEETDINLQPLTEQDNPLGNASMQRTHVYQKTDLANMSIDYVQPLAKRGTIEMGYKGIIRYLNSDFERSSQVNGDYIIDPLNTGIFDFHEQIHAVYTQYTGWSGEIDVSTWKYNVGVRAEKVWNNGETLEESEAFSNEYFNLFPSANLFYYTQKRNNIKLSYSRRIVRPGLGQLNPFTDITDSLNQRAGNPMLQPELIHSMEVGYNHSLQKASLSITGFYRIRNNAIFPYTILDENGVAFTQPLNFGTATTLGLEAIATYDPFSFWNISFSFSTYKVRIDDEGMATEVSTSLISWYTKLINNFSPFRNTKLQIIGNYTSPTAIPQGESVAVYFVDMGIQQKIIKGKGRVGLVVTDVFNTQEYGFYTSDYNFSFSRRFKLDTRAIMLTFGYAFGTSFKENLMENKFKND